MPEAVVVRPLEKKEATGDSGGNGGSQGEFTCLSRS